jgi:tetratricopeptide (TPR) repeat protein
MRLSAATKSVKDAISVWQQRGGEGARKYALSREYELLSPKAKKILLAASVIPGPVSFVELEDITGYSSEVITSAMQELQSLFLVPKPRIVKDEQRFEVNYNTRALVIEQYGDSAEMKRIRDAYQAFSQKIPVTSNWKISALIRQAVYLIKAGRHGEAEHLLAQAIEKYPQEPDLCGVLGFVYKSWQPVRLTDAREKFARAYKLGSCNQEMFDHWCGMEIKEQEWSRAIDVAEKGLKRLPENKHLLYLNGYVRTRLSRELLSGLHADKAKKEAGIAKDLLIRALSATEKSDFREKTPNSHIYRAIIISCEIIEDFAGLKEYFKRWTSDYPEDPYAKSEWARVSRKCPR